MAGLVPAIHAIQRASPTAWMAGTRPAMTATAEKGRFPEPSPSGCYSLSTDLYSSAIAPTAATKPS